MRMRLTIGALVAAIVVVTAAFWLPAHAQAPSSAINKTGLDFLRVS